MQDIKISVIMPVYKVEKIRRKGNREHSGTDTERV